LNASDSYDLGRIFFLGAGFSAGAGVPLTNKLLPRAARIFQDEAPDLYDRVNGFARDVDVDLNDEPNAEQFSRLCNHLEFMELRERGGGERWSDQGSRERLALKFFLSKTIAIATPEATNLPTFYARFASDLRASDVVVTFNWDVLLEKTLSYAGVAYSYAWEEDKTLILKLHGSVNWINGTPQTLVTSARSFSYHPIGYAGGMVENEVYFSEILHRPAEWAAARCLVDEVQPLIVLPGYGKAVDVRLLSAIWYRLEFLNVRRGGVSIIGMSVADDDYVIESLFRYLFRSIFDLNTRVRILNPDESVGKKFRTIAPDMPLSFTPNTFSKETVDWALLKE
jgi:hypothetical protein